MGLSTQPSKREPLSAVLLGPQRTTSSTTVATSLPVDDTEVGSGVNDPQSPVPIDASWLTEYQPNGSNLWFIHDWGIASMLRYLRDDLDTEPAERLQYLEEAMGTTSAEVADSPDVSYRRVGQIIELPAVRPWPEEATAEAAKADQSDTRASDRRVDTFVGHSCSTEGAMVTDFGDQVVKAAWRRQEGRCANCGRWLIWTYRGRNCNTGAWQSHHMTPSDQGGSSALNNCVIFCSGIANCHFSVGHGGVGWSHYAPLDDSLLLFFHSVDQVTKMARESTKRSLIREVFSIRQTTKAKGRTVQKQKHQSESEAGAEVTRKKSKEA